MQKASGAGITDLSKALQLLPVMARLSKPTGECLQVNPAWLSTTGRSGEEELGIGWLSSVHPDDRRTVLASFHTQGSSVTGISRSFRLRSCDGPYLTVRERDVWGHNESGEPIEVLSVGSMAEGVLSYDELQSWAHELRGTLNTIVGWTELVHSGLLSPDDAGNGVQAIRRAARQHADTIGNLLKSVRLREDLISLETSAVSFGEVMTRATKALPPEIDRARITFELHEEVLIAADATQAEKAFAQVLQTLVLASPPSTSFVVRVSAEAESIHVRIDEDTSVTQGQRLVEELPAGALGRYLTRLAYARSFICGSGGRIELRRAGDALVFQATLPRGIAAVTEPVAAGPALDGLRVLLVDDDAEARKIGDQMLTRFGAHVTTAASVREARDILDHDEIVDVLVSDIAMPDEDGYELVRSLRKMPGARARIPAVALTSHTGPSTERRTRVVGFQRCLFKPTEANVLASAIHDVWRDRQSNQN